MGNTKPNRFERTGPPYNPGLKQFINAKRNWHYQPDAHTTKQGFLGWHERGYLPHFDAPNVTQFVTFSLRDAFPVTRRREWEALLKEGDETLCKRKLEAWLDRGHGECWLRHPEIAERVEQVLRAGDGHIYRLHAWTLMPNHVHLAVEVWQAPLSHLLQQWKGRSAREANKELKRQGPFWEREYFDTLIRDEAHLRQAIRYTENNPVKAGFVREPGHWLWSSARYRDDFLRLPARPIMAPSGNSAG